MITISTVCISLILTYLLVQFGSFPYFALSVIAITLSSSIYWNKNQKTIQSRLSYALIVLLSMFLVLRANTFLTFLNLASIVYLTSEMILDTSTIRNLIRIIFAPLIAFSVTVATKIKPAKIKLPDLTKYLPSFIVSFLILAVIIPLLSSANPIFAKLVQSLVDLEIFKRIFTENLLLNTVRVAVFSLFLFFIPRLTTNAKSDTKTLLPQQSDSTFSSILFALPKVATILVLSIFFITQFQLYFSSEETLLALGYSNSEYAREVFGQLSFVTLLTFLLIYFDTAKNKMGKITTYLLLAQMVFLNLMALKSVYEYTSNWGYTFKRLYGYTVVFWLFGILTLFFYIYQKAKSYDYFLKSAVIITALAVVSVNIANFDKLIYYSAQSMTHKGTDYEYLAGLSSDSGSFKDQIEVLDELQKDSQIDLASSAFWILRSKIVGLQTEYKSFDVRSFNFSRYREYQRVKDIDTSAIGTTIEKAIEAKYNTITPTPEPRIRGEVQNTVEVTILNLPEDFRDGRYYLRTSATQEWMINGVEYTGQLKNDTFTHPNSTGSHYVSIVRKENIDNHIYTTSIELQYTISQNDLIRGNKSLSY